MYCCLYFFFFSSRRRHTRCLSDWSSDVCSSDLSAALDLEQLKRKYNLTNLEIQQLPIERVDALGRRFDLIVCTGVLHHRSEERRVGKECRCRRSQCS